MTQLIFPLPMWFFAQVGIPYQSITHAFREIIKSEGFVNGMYKGLVMNWFKGPVVSELAETWIRYAERNKSCILRHVRNSSRLTVALPSHNGQAVGVSFVTNDLVKNYFVRRHREHNDEEF